MKVIDKAPAAAGQNTYQLRLIHGYNGETSLQTMISDWYKYEPKLKRIIYQNAEHGYSVIKCKGRTGRIS